MVIDVGLVWGSLGLKNTLSIPPTRKEADLSHADIP
jgi:hypothetical protein